MRPSICSEYRGHRRRERSCGGRGRSLSKKTSSRVGSQSGSSLPDCRIVFWNRNLGGRGQQQKRRLGASAHQGISVSRLLRSIESSIEVRAVGKPTFSAPCLRLFHATR